MHTDTDLRTRNRKEKIKFVERNTSAQIVYISLEEDCQTLTNCSKCVTIQSHLKKQLLGKLGD